jgi:glycosyltransferase involved in cell wall biosynthesis
MVPEPPTVACFATQGPGSNDEQRIRELLALVGPELVALDRGSRVRGLIGLMRSLRALDPDLVVMEGTGIAGGLALLLGRRPYIVSSGDAVAPFVAAVSRPLGLVFGVYERLLCRRSAGFIGWSPYLAGRALTYGAPRAMTAANWAEHAPSPDGRERVRSRLSIGRDDVVLGIVGSLNWTARHRYCYGMELVRAVRRVARDDVKVLVVGDGDGLARLRAEAGDALGRSVLLPGRIPRDAVADHLAAMDVASLPQSVDRVGAFRYTTKISEYLAARLPVVTGQIPLAYDLDDGWLWRLPGDAPWEDAYVAALAALMESLDAEALAAHRPLADVPGLFSRERQQRVVAEFVTDVLARERSG